MGPKKVEFHFGRKNWLWRPRVCYFSYFGIDYKAVHWLFFAVNLRVK